MCSPFPVRATSVRGNGPCCATSAFNSASPAPPSTSSTTSPEAPVLNPMFACTRRPLHQVSSCCGSVLAALKPPRTHGCLPALEPQLALPQVQRPATMPWTGNTAQERPAYCRASSRMGLAPQRAPCYQMCVQTFSLLPNLKAPVSRRGLSLVPSRVRERTGRPLAVK